MASTKADKNRVAWKYTDHLANEYAISAPAVYVLDGVDGAKYGGGAAAATDLALPGGFRPRRVRCISAGKPDRWLIAYTEAAALWTTPGTTVTRDVNGVDTVYTSTADALGEKLNRAGTRQSA